MADEKKIWYCPRCDRPYDSLDEVKTHVTMQHPDHDPLWYDSGEPV